MFVAFLHEAHWKMTADDRKKLEQFGFVMPDEEFVRIWEAEKLREQRRGEESEQRRRTESVPLVVSEAHRKGAQTSYKARDKEGKQEELSPKLQEEIDKRRAARDAGKSFAAKERFGWPSGKN